MSECKDSTCPHDVFGNCPKDVAKTISRGRELTSERQTQAELILKHLQAGNSLTVFQAMYEPFRCMALSQRCGDLKRAGYPIKSEMVKLPSGKRVA